MIPNFVVICEHCLESSSSEDGLLVELNFKDKTVYTICPKCKKKNEMGLRPPKTDPLPRTRIR